jgi:PAS domain S-box-containing protein
MTAAVASGSDRLDADGGARVLVVDDDAANLAALDSVLAGAGLELVTAQSGVEAMKHLLNGDFAVILLDINMPALDGIQTARLIRERERSRDIPIIFITAYQPDQAQILEGYASGAVDYLIKPVNTQVLRSKVRIFIDLFRKKRQIEWQARQLRSVNHRLQREIEQREAAERDAAFEREERQRVVLASIADAVITTDAAGLVTSLNPVAEQLAGMSAAQSRGLTPGAVLWGILPEHLPPLERIVERSLGAGERLRGAAPIELETAAGTRRYLEYSAAPIRDSAGAIVGSVVIAQDITARHAAELERTRALRLEQEARQAAERANRARDDFLSVISHELRTPLNAIVGWAYVLRTTCADQGQTVQAVEAIHRGAMAQKRLIEDLLDMSRIINGKVDLALQRIDFTALVRNAVETVRPLASEKSVALQCQFGETLGEVVADRVRIEQVIWNVLANAVKFTPEGGQVDLALAQRGGMMELVVRDSGEGMSPEVLPHIFEAFRQGDSSTTRKRGGLGLGLAIARQLVDMHGGRITASSEGPGRGAIFTVALPCAAPEWTAASGAAGQAATERSEPQVSEQDLSAVRVLIVDDDQDTLDLVRIVLSSAGAVVRVAHASGDALRQVAEWKPDLLLSDITMPEEDGYTVIGRLRALPAELGGDTPAAALTAMAGDEDRARALAAGFQVHIAKPLEPGALLRVVTELTRRGAARRPGGGGAR